MHHITGTNRQQSTLFPEVLDDFISAENPVRFIDACADSLDLKKLGFTHTHPLETGLPPYHPADLLKLYIYGYLKSMIYEVMSLLRNSQTANNFPSENSSTMPQVIGMSVPREHIFFFIDGFSAKKRGCESTKEQCAVHVIFDHSAHEAKKKNVRYIVGNTSRSSKRCVLVV